MPFFLLLNVSGIAAFMAAVEIMHRIARVAILRKVLFVLCLLAVSVILLLVAYLIWIGMGVYFLMSLPVMIFIVIVAMPSSHGAKRIEPLGNGRILYGATLVAFLSFAAALGYLILLVQLGFAGRIRLI